MGYLNGNVRICFCAIAAKRLTKLCERSTSQVPSFSQIAFLTGNWTPYELHGAAWIDTIHLSKSPTLAITVSTLPTSRVFHLLTFANIAHNTTWYWVRRYPYTIL